MKLKRTLRSYLLLILFIFIAVATFSFLNAKKPQDTSAASLANFKPGNIISDYVMSNYASMSEAEIQNFLKSKNSCNDTRTYLASTYSNYSYHVKDGHFVCLADETFGDGVDYGDSAPNGQSAAHIIWQAAQDYQINPQVLIVLLQKEQSLITDTWPNSRQFRSATGYGCPDTAACDTKYYGFKNQVRNAASLFRTVLNGGWTNYPVGNNYIQYNPNADCGGSVVYIENLATSSLYRYTPYQPNAGALAAGYGTAPSCGAYGNRNFYLYFMDWFSDPTITVEPVVEAETKFEQPIQDGTYQFISKAYPDKAIDIKGGIKIGANSGELQIYPKKDSGKENQMFEVKYDERNGYYSISNSTANLAFDIKGARTSNSTQVQIYSAHDNCNQDWLFEKDSEGYFTIISRCSSRVLDATASNRIVIFDNHGGDNQKWQLVKN